MNPCSSHSNSFSSEQREDSGSQSNCGSSAKLDDRKVEEVKTNKISHKFFNPRYINIALLIGGIVGVGLIGLSLGNIFAPQMIPLNAQATPFLLVSGSLLALGGVIGIIGLVKNSRTHHSMASLTKSG